MNEANIKDKVVVITGASQGIGRATADQLRSSGVKLVLGSRNTEQLSKDFATKNCLVLPLDVSDEKSVENFVAETIHTFGRVDVLINSAGTGTFAGVLESDTEDFDRMLNVNLRGTYLTCKHFGAHMVEQGEGHIMNMVSIAGKTALPGCSGYASSKFGVSGFTKVLQAELRQKGIQVTAVVPGSVSSSFWDKIDNPPELDNMIPTEAMAKQLTALIDQPQGAYIDEITIMPPLGIL